MSENNPKKKKDRKGAFALGLVIILLAVIGAGFLVNTGISQIHKLTDNEKEKKEYTSYLSPVVTLDVNPFDDITGADMKDLICSSILSLLDDGEKSPYEFEFVEGEVSGMGIPQKTVEEAFKALFGTEVKPVHQSVECSTCIFTYQSQQQRYIIPVTGYDPAYVPEIAGINKTKEGSIELLTGYISYGDWSKAEGKFESPEPSKYRKITLRKADKGYYISAIQNAEASNKK
ncbi:MAG: hypothetical protein MJ147_00515 [Clostridia bacterium]|nr:hypothetical protein [Clostridia bacterium]